MTMMTRCALCPGLNACIPPDGPQQSGRILFIGEAPGKDDNRRALKEAPGRPFMGQVGQEVDGHYLPLAGLRRSEVCFTNTLACLPITAGGKVDPQRKQDAALLTSCTNHHLYPYVERTAPALLVPLGGIACRAVFGESFDLELKHGLPTESPWGIPAFPMYHPALGIHEPKKMLYIRTDWQRLRSYLNGTFPQRLDPFAGCEDYQEVIDADEIQDIPDGPLGCDTESRRGGEPFCLTYSYQSGTGRLIRATNPSLLRVFGSHLRTHHGPILFHNWLYDWQVVEAMGLSFQSEDIVDTMARVFQLGNLPQGLKALAFRELGMAMQDFDDLVTPYSRENTLLYYMKAKSFNWPKPEEELKIDDKTGLWKLYKPQGMNTKLKRFFTDLAKNPEGKDVFKTWDNWESSQPMMEAEIGPWPGKCITHVPFDQVLHYACRDADALIRLWPVLERMRKVVRKFTQEHWRNQYVVP